MMIGIALISYNPRPPIRILKLWSVAFAAVAAIILFFAVLDLVGLSNFWLPLVRVPDLSGGPLFGRTFESPRPSRPSVYESVRTAAEA